MQKTDVLTNIVILGGGFAGTRAAIDLAKKNPPNTKITLISNKSYFEYYPGLYRVVTGASPIEVCVPLEDMVPPSVDIVIDTITAIDTASKKIVGAQLGEIEYSTLIVALGSETTYFNLPGLDTLSLGFKSTKEALRLKHHIFELFKTHMHPNQNELTSHFHVVVVGGGPSGVEVAGDLTAFMHALAKKTGVDPSLVTIDLIESNPRLVPALPPEASEKILRRLRMLGVNIFLNRRLIKEEVESVYMKDMSLQTKTVIWTAGTQINQLVSDTKGLTFSERKRVVVDEYLRAVGVSDVYMLGDLAATQYSGLAQTAMYDGSYVAKMIARELRGKPLVPYTPKKVAYSIPVGDNWAALVIGPVRIYGRFAYLMRHAIDFHFFSGILSVRKLISLFFEGWKYRNVEYAEEPAVCKLEK